MTFMREELQEFSETGEAAPPPVFFGRQDVLWKIQDRAITAGKTGHAGFKDIRVIQGAPGAGESSTIAEMEKWNLRRDPDGSVGFPRVLSVSSAGMDNMGRVLTAIGATASMKTHNWREWFGKFSIKAVSLGPVNPTIELTRESGNRLEDPSKLDKVFPVEK